MDQDIALDVDFFCGDPFFYSKPKRGHPSLYFPHRELSMV
jgi:hypothetical protein